jgi:hypothetical protein
MLFDLDAVSPLFRESLISRKGEDVFPVVHIEAGVSLRDGLEEKFRGFGAGLSKVVFVDCLGIGESEMPDEVRRRKLFAVVAQVRDEVYVVFLRDREGWISIRDEEITPVGSVGLGQPCLLGYIDDIGGVNGFRYPVPVVRECVGRVFKFDASTMECVEICSNGFANPKECLVFLAKQRADHRRSEACYAIDETGALTERVPTEGEVGHTVEMFFTGNTRMLETFRNARTADIIVRYARVRELALPVKFEAAQTIADVAEFCRRLLDVVLKLEGIGEIRVSREGSTMPLNLAARVPGNGILEFDIADAPQSRSPRPVVVSGPMIQYTMALGETLSKESKRAMAYNESLTVAHLLRDAARTVASAPEAWNLYRVDPNGLGLTKVLQEQPLKTVANEKLRVERAGKRMNTVVMVTSKEGVPQPTGIIFRLPVLDMKLPEAKLAIEKYLGRSVSHVGSRTASGSISWTAKNHDHHIYVAV